MKCLISFLIFLLPNIVLAGRWIDHGNAGDVFAAEFILTGRDLIQRMRLVQDSIQPLVDIDQLATKIQTTKVQSEDDLMLRGVAVDAINIPDESLILVSRNRWRDVRSVVETRARLLLVLHEYLGIMRIDDHDFSLSGHLLSFLNVQNYSPSTWWNPLNPVNFISVSLQRKSEKCQVKNLVVSPDSEGEYHELETTGDCGLDYRRVEIVKQSGQTPADSQIKGTFHKFTISIFDRLGDLINEFEYEPEWGQCLLPEDGTCQLSGALKLSGLQFTFWFTRQ